MLLIHRMKKVLYISYDGMTDPLGQSQVINYLLGLSKKNYRFDILSFEKPERFKSQGDYIKSLLQKNDIGWYPQIFHSKVPFFSKVLDKMTLLNVARRLNKKNKYDLIHCRSYLAAEAGLKLKNESGVKFLFDMRGFWADEKKDGGSWDIEKWYWRKIYLFYKKKEQQFIENADHIISLTRKGKNEIQSWYFYNNKVPLTVIPCCADGEHFALTSNEKKSKAREKIRISSEDFVVSYLGSVGTWYMLDEMLQFFNKLYERNNNAFFLILTNSKPDDVLERIRKNNINAERVKIFSVPFTDVPFYMYASDVSLSFIKPVYSKISSSPVKIGEILSMGIPIIANDIGDSGNFIEEHHTGIMVRDLSEKEMKNAITKIDSIIKLDPVKIRKQAISEYSLEKGINLYSEVYQHLLG